MAAFLEQLGSELSLFRSDLMQANWNKGLHFCRTEFAGDATNYEPTEDDNLLYDVMLKSLQRGRRPFSSYFTEKWIISLYGLPFHIEKVAREGLGSISYSYDDQLLEDYKTFTDVVDPWLGNPVDVSFDPENPENERALFTQLLNRFGSKIAHFAEPQADLPTILDRKDATAFAAQRADLLLSFPNGSRLLLEPGDHDDSRQIALDQRRDDAFKRIGTTTFRPKNSEINESQLYERIQRHLETIGAFPYLKCPTTRTAQQVAANYLFYCRHLLHE